MKPAMFIAAAGIASLAIAGATPAGAYHLSPTSTSFTGTGNTSATKNGISLPCKAHFTGNTSRTGVGHITGGSFQNTTKIGCTAVKLINLPWKALAKTRTKVIIYNVEFSSPIGNCGPGNLPTRLKSGVVTFTDVPLPGGCTVSGKIKTSPTVSIVP